MNGGAVIRGWLHAPERAYPFVEWPSGAADRPSGELRPVPPAGPEVGDLRPEVTAVGDGRMRQPAVTAGVT
jgi:hypothetical protein